MYEGARSITAPIEDEAEPEYRFYDDEEIGSDELAQALDLFLRVVEVRAHSYGAFPHTDDGAGIRE